MKKQILIAIISALVLSLGAYAHAPKKIKLSLMTKLTVS
jgi:hypothetical protein